MRRLLKFTEWQFRFLKICCITEFHCSIQFMLVILWNSISWSANMLTRRIVNINISRGVDTDSTDSSNEENFQVQMNSHTILYRAQLLHFQNIIQHDVMAMDTYTSSYNPVEHQVTQTTIHKALPIIPYSRNSHWNTIYYAVDNK